MDVYDGIEAEVLKAAPPSTKAAKAAFAPGTVAGVLRGLVGGGMGFLDVLKWLPVVLQLIATVGPLVQDIIKQIQDAINGGQTPETFVP